MGMKTHQPQLDAWHAAQRLDLLAAAWQFTQPELEAILRLPPGALSAWRTGDPIGWTEGTPALLAEIERLALNLWCHLPYDRWPAFWRRPWTASSPLAGRSPLAELDAGGPAAITRLADSIKAGISC